MNYVPEIRNGCDIWEQVYCRYCVIANRWGYKDSENVLTYKSNKLNDYLVKVFLPIQTGDYPLNFHLLQQSMAS